MKFTYISYKVSSFCNKPCDRAMCVVWAFAGSAITELHDKGISSGRVGKMKIGSKPGGAQGLVLLLEKLEVAESLKLYIFSP